MSKICTDIPQSKKLLELGLNTDTADMCWCSETDNITVPYKDVLPSIAYCPAWSFEALTELKHDLQGCVTILIKGENGCCMSIVHPIFLTVMETEMMTNSPLDAAFETVCWLLKNGHIKTGKK